MRFSSKGGIGFAKGDMTPMIDMTFQLIAFFMVLINFAEGDRSERINLPASELAKPPDAPLEAPLTLQLTRDGKVMIHADVTSVENLQPLLLRERQAMEAEGGSASKTTVIIRADQNTKTGTVQNVIEACQKTGFEKFALRAKQEERT